MKSRAFWLAALERAIKSFAQTLLGFWLIGDVTLDVFNFEWTPALGLALGAFLISMFTSIVSDSIGESGPSLTTERLSGRHRLREGSWTPRVT